VNAIAMAGGFTRRRGTRTISISGASTTRQDKMVRIEGKRRNGTSGRVKCTLKSANGMFDSAPDHPVEARSVLTGKDELQALMVVPKY